MKTEPTVHGTKRHRRVAFTQIQTPYTKMKKGFEPKPSKSLIQSLIGVVLVLLWVGTTQHWEFL